MARRGISEAQQHLRAVQGGRRMIAQGERPGYRLVALPDGSWGVVGLPGVVVAAPDRRAAVEPMRAALAAVLDVPMDAFDLDV